MSLKQERIAERIREILSDLLLREISDPRLQGVTVTEVNIDAEIQYASVYVNALGDESREDDVMQGLTRASGFMRREMGKRLRTRTTPELHFYWDTTLEEGERLNQLIDKLDIPDDIELPSDDDLEIDMDFDFEFGEEDERYDN